MDMTDFGDAVEVASKQTEAMRLFLDCEWNDYKGSLISMALVSEDGREWYEVLPVYQPSAWVAKHVMPILNKEPLFDANAMSCSLEDFLTQFDSVHIIADWPEDIAHFCNILVTGPGRRIRTPPLTLEVLRICSESATPHNALSDARGIRDAVLAHRARHEA